MGKKYVLTLISYEQAHFDDTIIFIHKVLAASPNAASRVIDALQEQNRNILLACQFKSALRFN